VLINGHTAFPSPPPGLKTISLCVAQVRVYGVRALGLLGRHPRFRAYLAAAGSREGAAALCGRVAGALRRVIASGEHAVKVRDPLGLAGPPSIPSSFPRRRLALLRMLPLPCTRGEMPHKEKKRRVSRH
jgi:hypothetical protein